MSGGLVVLKDWLSALPAIQIRRPIHAERQLCGSVGNSVEGTNWPVTSSWNQVLDWLPNSRNWSTIYASNLARRVVVV